MTERTLLNFVSLFLVFKPRCERKNKTPSHAVMLHQLFKYNSATSSKISPHLSSLYLNRVPFLQLCKLLRSKSIKLWVNLETDPIQEVVKEWRAPVTLYSAEQGIYYTNNSLNLWLRLL